MTTPLILLVEDEESHAELVRRAWEDDRFAGMLRVVGSLAEARDVLAGAEPRLLLADLLLPDGRGIELVSECVERDIPVVILTSHGDETVAVDAMRAGAIDYVVKSPETLLDMPRVIERAIREHDLIRERKRLEGELRQSQKLEAIGQLSSGIAHDFNNLLMAVMGCADLALRQLEAEHPATELVGEIKQAARRGSAMCRQLVTFSRKQDADPQRFDLNETVERARRLLQPLVGVSVNFRMQLTAGRLPVYCDPNQIEQALFNLVVNARDAMPSGGLITLRTERRDDHVVLIVRDTGVGMSADTVARAFEPFFTTKPVGKGTGLGLSSVYGIIKRAGGTLEINSEPGRGTAITIELPLDDERPEGDIVPAAPSDRGVPASIVDETRRPPRVLFVEDHKLSRATACALLDSMGFETIGAASGTDAIAAASKDDVDVLVVDLGLPDMPGATLARQLQARVPDLPVLFISGRGANDPVVLAALSLPHAHFAMKPIDIAELAEAVRQLVGDGPLPSTRGPADE